jgi:hypothetical protein
MRALWPLLLACLSLAACGDSRGPADGPLLAAPAPSQGVEGRVAPKGTALAYEHEVEVSLDDAEALAAATEALVAACTEQRFGDCALLNLAQHGGVQPHAEIELRLAPQAVAPTVDLVLAGGGTIDRRSTRAEDLADAMTDLRREREALASQRRHLDAAAQGRALSAADAIALAAELGRIDAQVVEIEARERGQQRRVDTNRLSLSLGLRQGQGEVLGAFHGLGDRLVGRLAEGVDEGLSLLAYLGPFLLLLLLPALGLLLAWRWLWRRATGAHRRGATAG